MGLAAHEDPGIRYHVATAISNLAAGDLPEESRATLTALARDPDAEVRFSAVFELGTWWQANHDEGIEAVLRTALRDSEPVVARTARTALHEA
jgi:vesicle coat complex subunit